MNSIKWSPKAVKQLLKVNKPERAGIKNAVGELAHMPDTRNVVALSNHKHQFRLRVGNYRVFLQLIYCSTKLHNYELKT